MTRAVVLAQGNELTTGQIADTNSAWIATRLWSLGIEVRRIIAAPDDLDDLVGILQEAAGLADVVVSTGGLGPTRDDLTAEAVAKAFGMPLALSTEALAQVEARYRAFGRPMPAINRKQAVLPEGCRVHENHAGTAPGFSVEVGESQLFFLPGVPREMRRLVDEAVLPALQARLNLSPPRTHTVRVIGLGESTIETRLQGLSVPGLTIGFRTQMPENLVKLRFDAGTPKDTIQQAISEVQARIGWRAFGVDCGDLSAVVGERLAQRGDTIALAESCTAGRVAAWLGEVPGASRYLIEGAVVYANAAKVRTAGVSEATLAEHGAVSEPVARQLAEGIRARAHTTFGIGITGIAGPGGGTGEKPVGTVHIALATKDGTHHQRLQLPGNRARVQALAAASALALLYRHVR